MRLETCEFLQTQRITFITNVIYPDDMGRLKELVKFSKNEGDNYLCLVTPELLIDLIGQSEELMKLKKEGSMKKFTILILILIAGLLTIGWEWTHVGHPWNLRPLTITDEVTFVVVSDSDTVWIEHTADREIDSVWVIGGVERGVTLELFFCPYGDSARVALFWFYGNDRYNLHVDTIVDTLLETADTLWKCYFMTHYQVKWASVMFGDSIGADGDSVRYWLVEYDQ